MDILKNSYYKATAGIKKPKISLKFPPILKRIFKYTLIFFISLLCLSLVSVAIIAIPLYGIYKDAAALKNDVSKLKLAARDQNLTQIEVAFTDFSTDLKSFKSKYNSRMGLLKNVPFTKEYYEDGVHLLNAAEYGMELGDTMVKVVEPFAGDLGFKVEGKEVENTDITTQERMIKLLKILPSFAPQVDNIAVSTKKIDDELSQIDETKYPQSFRGMRIRSQIASIKAVSHELANKSPQFKGLFNQIPTLMGVNGAKVYMISMANNYELRMSGGFNTYLVLVKVENGIPEILGSIDTFDIDRDKNWMLNLNVPYYLRDYLGVTRLYARDATSTSPDVVVAYTKFLNEFWKKDFSLYQKIDGVIQVDNFVVSDVLRVLGPVDAGGYSIRTDEGNYVGIPIKEFNSDNVILELERISGGSLKEIIGRKDIIKYLLNAILQKLLNESADNLAPTAQVFLQSLGSKDIVIYTFDPETQKAIEDLGYGGRIVSTPENWDYLHVNNSNLGAGKRDWIIKRTVEKKVYEEAGKKISEVKVTVVNPKSPDWWEWFPFYNDYVRIYVPKGSTLISASASDGQDIKAKTIEDLDKTVFDGFFKMQEDTTVSVTYKYELPANVDTTQYNLLIQKQPGTRGDIYELNVKSYKARFELSSDKKFTL